jgi:alkylation response protein AidB-like acyl-CoA dehydrogenase
VTVDFTLTDEQELLRDTARRLFEKECPPALVRAHADDPAAVDPLWPELEQWVALAEGPLTDLCLFAQEAGAALLPGPFFATAVLYASLVDSVDGTGTVALAGTDGHWVVNDDPVKTFVLEADVVDEIAFVLPGPRLLRAGGEHALRRVETLDTSRRVFEVEVPTGDAVDLDPQVVVDVVERATVALAAELVGTAQRLLDLSVEYAKERVQFDQPIGAFQAIQHKLADMALAVERATAAVYYAAMAIDADDPDRHRATHVAKAAAGEAATRAAKDGIQVHGGIGYTWEHDLHLYIRRAYASEHLLGPRAWHHDRLADLLFP